MNMEIKWNAADLNIVPDIDLGDVVAAVFREEVRIRIKLESLPATTGPAPGTVIEIKPDNISNPDLLDLVGTWFVTETRLVCNNDLKKTLEITLWRTRGNR